MTSRDLAAILCRETHAIIAADIQRPCPDCRATIRTLGVRLVPSDEVRHVIAQSLHTLDSNGVCECGRATGRDPEAIRQHQAGVVAEALSEFFRRA